MIELTPGFFAYSAAGIILGLFSLRVFRVFRREDSRIFQLIAQGSAFLAIGLILIGLAHGTPTSIDLTVIYSLGDVFLFLGLFMVHRFPLYFWGHLLAKVRPFLVAERVFLVTVVGVLILNAILLGLEVRKPPTLNQYGIVDHHAPFLFNFFKLYLIVSAGMSAGFTLIYQAWESRSVRSWLMGIGMTIMAIGGGIPAFPVTPPLVYLGISIMTVGGAVILAALLVSPKAQINPEYSPSVRN